MSTDQRDAPVNHPPDTAMEEADAELEAAEAAVDALFARFPPEERAAVAIGLYFDAAGQPQTRHRRLRAL